MNVETGLREAKLLDSGDGSEVNAVEVKLPDTEAVVKELNNVEYEDLTQQSEVDLLAEIPEVEEEDSEADKELRDKIRLSSSSGQAGQLYESIENIKKYQKIEPRILSQSLEVLADLGHELEFGERIVSRNTKELLEIIQKKQIPPHIREIAARALGASMRNNPGALAKVADQGIVKSLLETIDSSDNDKLSGRLIYALGSVVGTGEGSDLMGKHDAEYLEGRGGEVFRRAFDEGTGELKRKISTFVFDRALKLAWPDKEFSEWSDTFQGALVKKSLNGEDKLRVFEALTQIQEYMVDRSETGSGGAGEGRIVKRDVAEMLPVRDDFLQWLAKEADEYRDRQAINDDDDIEEQFKEILLQSRHSVFGNPMAGRKNEEL